ncbi:uncharacterized protein PV09_01648 [Verruconis gallopava]|uniref:SH3 domain-containing protein n=1 Tax=Verruconis gallopava TaxID=253628 RepID=A0A0D1XY22_9PEZI|nr:uncharacterized protein PV09_01648 [Verruconis gallopava]KIW07716.1 hypothetical protein PV09_01648 [Verruconis gallopava]
MEAFSVAMTNRSLRTVKAELEFLADNGTITHAQLSSILSQLPSETQAVRNSQATAVSAPTSGSVPVAPMSNLNLNGSHAEANAFNSSNEKQNGYYQPPAQEVNPPPAYPATPQPPVAAPLTYAVALYVYNGNDAGDLSLQVNDRIAVTEYMNADWWKGRNERTNQEGIFPRNYVKVEDVKAPAGPSSYGNMPMDVAQGGGSSQPSKGQEMGKKFGKKLGNAAIFGAGATMGSNLVNSIF